MTDYISRDAALNFELQVESNYHDVQQIMKGMALMSEYIKGIPAADVVEQKHGKWIGVSENDTHPRCSNCDRTRLGSSLSFCKKYVPFCEWCGARMDGE